MAAAVGCVAWKHAVMWLFGAHAALPMIEADFASSARGRSEARTRGYVSERWCAHQRCVECGVQLGDGRAARDTSERPAAAFCYVGTRNLGRALRRPAAYSIGNEPMGLFRVSYPISLFGSFL